MKRSTKRNVANNEGNHKITEYFSVRRSNRKTSTQLYKEKSDATIQAVISGSNEQNDCLRIVETIDQKGRGVIAARIFEKDDFVVEYRGDLIDANMAKHRERIYADDSTIGCYMYYFKHANRQYCVDATPESPYLGRLVNHSRLKPNLKTKVIEINGRPRLLLVAIRRIDIDEELLYDYGDRTTDAIASNPWLVDT